MADIKIYRTTYCPYCNMAERLFDYEDIDVTHDDELRRKLVEWTGKRTVPQIFIDDEPVGGYTDLKALQDSGELEQMLE